MIEPEFIESEARGIDLVLGEGWPGFNEALADSVSTMPFRGQSTTGLSTYWLDLLIERLEDRSDAPGVEQSVINGNATELIKVDDEVVARSLYELFEDERLLVAEMLPVLRLWREQVVAKGGTFTIPETYRRAPFPMPRGKSS